MISCFYIVLSGITVIMSLSHPVGSAQRTEAISMAILWAILAVAVKKDRGA